MNISTPLGNTHVYAYGPHYYTCNTFVKLVSHKKVRHFDAKFAAHMKISIPLGYTHVYAYGPHYFMANTLVKLISHTKARHFGAKFTPICKSVFAWAILTSTLMELTST